MARGGNEVARDGEKVSPNKLFTLSMEHITPIYNYDTLHVMACIMLLKSSTNCHHIIKLTALLDTVCIHICSVY